MIEALFASAGLFPRGPLMWNLDLPATGPDVFVRTRNGEAVYIGQTTSSLAQRLREFYRQQVGGHSATPSRA
ncbi:MAG TPA: hypothetical protein PKE45_13720 [Caldilineaceae bacterium]|nr:hypothetical protein [Caldilineaceae bacterium]